MCHFVHYEAGQASFPSVEHRRQNRVFQKTQRTPSRHLVDLGVVARFDECFFFGLGAGIVKKTFVGKSADYGERPFSGQQLVFFGGRDYPQNRLSFLVVKRGVASRVIEAERVHGKAFDVGNEPQLFFERIGKSRVLQHFGHGAGVGQDFQLARGLHQAIAQQRAVGHRQNHQTEQKKNENGFKVFFQNGNRSSILNVQMICKEREINK